MDDVYKGTSPNFAPNTKQIWVNQATPIFLEIIRKPFQGEQSISKSISPHSKLAQYQKRNLAKLPKIKKMYNILNNTARNLCNTEAARGFPWKQLFLKCKILNEVPLKFSNMLEKYLRRNSYWSKPTGFSQQLYQKQNSLTSISQGPHSLSKNTFHCQPLIIFIPSSYCTLTSVFGLFIFTRFNDSYYMCTYGTYDTFLRPMFW